jgi:hypothetical protein
LANQTIAQVTAVHHEAKRIQVSSVVWAWCWGCVWSSLSGYIY